MTMRCDNCDGLGSIVACKIVHHSEDHGMGWCETHETHECWVFGVTRIPCPVCNGYGTMYCCEGDG